MTRGVAGGNRSGCAAKAVRPAQCSGRALVGGRPSAQGFPATLARLLAGKRWLVGSKSVWLHQPLPFVDTSTAGVTRRTKTSP